MRITIYTIPKCKFCKQAKKYFISKNVGYAEVDMSIGGVPENIEMKKAFKKMGLKTYPVIVVEKDGEDEMIFPEFDRKLFDDLIKEK